MATAQSETAESSARFNAIRTLLRFFLCRLEEHSKLCPEFYGEQRAPRQFWYDKMREIQDRGVWGKVRVCCCTDGHVRVRLQFNGTPGKGHSLILPDVSSSSDSCRELGGECERLRRRECSMFGQVVEGCVTMHGFRLFALASDFLCQSCQNGLHDLDLDTISDVAVKGWLVQLGVVSHTSKALDEQRVCLSGEQKRLRARTALVVRATRALSCPDDQANAFTDFMQPDLSMFERSVCQEGISVRRISTLESDPRSSCGDGNYQGDRGLGVKIDSATGEVWARAVAIEECPDRWHYYSGDSRFVSNELWWLRAWCRVVGGFSHVSYSLQCRLLALGNAEDQRYLFVLNPKSRDGALWEHVVLSHPGGVLPNLNTWHDLCDDAIKDCEGDGWLPVSALRSGVCKILEDNCLLYSAYGHKYILSSKKLREAGSDEAAVADLEKSHRWVSAPPWSDVSGLAWCVECAPG